MSFSRLQDSWGGGKPCRKTRETGALWRGLVNRFSTVHLAQHCASVHLANVDIFHDVTISNLTIAEFYQAINTIMCQSTASVIPTICLHFSTEGLFFDSLRNIFTCCSCGFMRKAFKINKTFDLVQMIL